MSFSSARIASLLFATLTLLFGFALYPVFQRIVPATSAADTFEFMEYFEISSSLALQMTHRAIVLFLVFAAIAGSLLAFFNKKHAACLTHFLGRLTKNKKAAIPAIAGVLLLGLSLDLAYFREFSDIFTFPTFRQILINLAVVWGLVLIPSSFWQKNRKIIIGILSVSVAGLLFSSTVFGILVRPYMIAAPATAIDDVGLHYSAMLGASELLGRGFHLFDETVTTTYGMLIPVLHQIYETNVHKLSWGSEMTCVQVIQLVFWIVTVAALKRRYKSNPLLIMAAIMILLPWVNNTSQAIFYPNQSGVRFFGFPLAVLTILTASTIQRVSLAAALSAVVSVFCLFLNPETGVAVSLGLSAYLFCRIDKTNLSHVFHSVAGFLIGATLLFAAVIVTIKAGLGYWPLLDPLKIAAEMISRTNGNGGFVFVWRLDNLLLAFMAVHVFVVFLYPFFRHPWWKQMPLRSAETVGICTIFIIWLAYYLYRPVPWNMWSSLPVYCFLLDTLFARDVLFKIRKQKIWALLDARMVFFAALLVPITVSGSARAYHGLYVTCAESSIPATYLYSDLFFPSFDASAMTRKAAYYNQFLPDQKIGYFTSNMHWLDKTIERGNTVPYYAPFFQAIMRKDYDRMLAKIQESDTMFLFFDDPESELAGNAVMKKYFARVREDLSSSFAPYEKKEGWIVLKRKETKE